jgi:flagellar biosynthesis GTPase FlhF
MSMSATQLENGFSCLRPQDNVRSVESEKMPTSSFELQSPIRQARRTLDHCFSFGQNEFREANSAQENAMDRACPKEIRAPPLLIGVAGGTASGKTTVCRKIAEVMADDRVAIISMDNFYRPLTAEEKADVDSAWPKPAA